MNTAAMYRSGHEDIAGDWAQNLNGQIVAAWDVKRAPKGTQYEYFCHCMCGGEVILRRGKIKRPHFAYKTNRRNGCKGGTTCPETELHYNAKWLLCDIFPKINFWRVCHSGHRITKDQYTGPEWTATVEKQIPGTDRRIADVLLQNSHTGISIALEVHNTNAVEKKKREECALAGVYIIEIDADSITPDNFDLDNEQNEYQCKDCSICIREDQERHERAERYRIWWHQNERERIAREDRERENKRLQTIAEENKRLQTIAEEDKRLMQIAANEKQREEYRVQKEIEENERLLQKAIEEHERLLQKAAEERELENDRLLHDRLLLSIENEEWIKQEPARKKIRLEEQAVRRNTQLADRQRVQLATRQQQHGRLTYMNNIQSWFKKQER